MKTHQHAQAEVRAGRQSNAFHNVWSALAF
jgi:hypothetical protein